MEKFVEQTLLYDFYGELLTEHQRSVYEDAVFERFIPVRKSPRSGGSAGREFMI